VAAYCRAFDEGEAESYPIKPEKIARPERFGTVYVLRRGGYIWVVRRPPSGLLGGMLALPSSEWSETRQDAAAPIDAEWEVLGEVRHVFTHFSLKLIVMTAEAPDADLPQGFWTPEDALSGLPTVFAKAAALAGLSARRKR
jgi:A/G-specific adenine glycosylase